MPTYEGAVNGAMSIQDALKHSRHIARITPSGRVYQIIQHGNYKFIASDRDGSNRLESEHGTFEALLYCQVLTYPGRECWFPVYGQGKSTKWDPNGDVDASIRAIG